MTFRAKNLPKVFLILLLISPLESCPPAADVTPSIVQTELLKSEFAAKKRKKSEKNCFVTDNYILGRSVFFEVGCFRAYRDGVREFSRELPSTHIDLLI